MSRKKLGGMFSDVDIREIVAHWQDILRLRDWDIRSLLVEKTWRKNGDVKIDMSNRMATVMVNRELDPAHLEEVVIHELLHIKLYGLDQMIEHLIEILYGDDEDARKQLNWGFFMEMLESTTEDLTKGYLQASGKRNSLNFTRVDRQVQEELGE